MIVLVIELALLGLIVWALITYVPMPEAFKKLIVIVAVVAAVIYILQLIGALNMGPPIPRIH